MSNTEDEYRLMLNSFRTNDLRALLGVFGHNKDGQKSHKQLKERALELLRNKPVGLNYQSYLSKIFEIYHIMQSYTSNNDMLINMIQNQRQRTMSIGMQQAQQPPQYFQQSVHVPRAGLPQVIFQIQCGNNENSFSGDNNIQSSYQSVSPRNIELQGPLSQQVNTVAIDHLTSGINNVNSFTPSFQCLANAKLKKLPFYEVIAEIIKPSTLIGHKKCSTPNTPKGMREETFKFTLSCEQATDIVMHRDTSKGKNEYVYQLQIRICLLKPESTEMTDCLPLGLHIRLNYRFFPLPQTAHNTQPARRTAQSINCTELVKLNPSIENTITVNWIPDAKTYVMGMYLVKKLTPDDLLQKLYDKGPRNSDETKDYIIKKLADFDQDLVSTPYRFSLVCPLGRVRMKIPAKSANCDHLQCFDASTFILMNEKKPTWMCPTCNRPIFYDDLRIESYFWEVLSSPNLPDNCKEIELLADGTWQVHEKVAAEVKEKLIDFVNLDDIDDKSSSELLKVKQKHDRNPECSKESENLNLFFIDLTVSDDEEPKKVKTKQENEAHTADVVQPVTTIDLKPLALVQPQQTVTSSEQGVIIEIDSSPSPPASPTPNTTAF